MKSKIIRLFFSIVCILVCILTSCSASTPVPSAATSKIASTSAATTSATDVQNQMSLLLQSQLTSANAQITLLQNQLNSANAQVASLQSQLTSANSKATSLQSQVNSANTQVTSLQSQLNSANTQVSSLQSQLNSANSEVSTLQGKLKNLEEIVALKRPVVLVQQQTIKQPSSSRTEVVYFKADYAGYLTITGTTSLRPEAEPPYFQVLNSASFVVFPNYIPLNHMDIPFPPGSTLTIPVLPGTVTVFFGNKRDYQVPGDVTATLTISFNY